MKNKIQVNKTVKIGPIENFDCEYWFCIEDDGVYDCDSYIISSWSMEDGKETRGSYIWIANKEELLAIAEGIRKFVGEP